jgi:hypothetical protein
MQVADCLSEAHSLELASVLTESTAGIESTQGTIV